MKRALSISGGADSVYLLHRMLAEEPAAPDRPLLLHVNHRLRGEASDGDQRFVESLACSLGLPLVVSLSGEHFVEATGIEARARAQRYSFIRKICSEKGVRRVLVAHTADDQVETILMRFLEGAGISGLKGIPASGEGGIERPLLDVWRSEILEALSSSGIGYRTDESNLDTRYERNWIRHVLLPLLVDRYGETVKKRIHALGERFRELDAFVGNTALRWVRKNVKGVRPTFSRSRFASLPSPVRIAILQRLVREHGGKSPNERLLVRLDRLVIAGKPSARLRVSRETVFWNEYDKTSIGKTDGTHPNPPEAHAHAVAIPDGSAGEFLFSGNGSVSIEVRTPPVSRGRDLLKHLIETGDRNVAVFDLASVGFPLTLSPLVAGDVVSPFGGGGTRKAKEIMIDLKIPRELRWGRATLRDASGRILWIPGVARSGVAPVDGRTRQLLCLAARPL